MMSGTAVSQIIPLVAAPLLTRMYSLEDFGVLAFFTSVTAVVSIMATGMYQFAVVMPESDEDAANVAVLTVILALAAAGLVYFALAFGLSGPVARLMGAPGFAKWLYIAPFMVIIMSAYNVLLYWANRKKNYGRMAISGVAWKAGTEGSKLGMGISRIIPHGLVWGSLAGQLLATGLLGWQIGREDLGQFRNVSIKKMKSNMSRFRRLPLFTMPYSLIDGFAGEFIIFALTSFKFLAIAGLFGFMRRLVIGPVSFLSSSLGQVFFQEASVTAGTPKLEKRATELMMGMAQVFTPIFIFFMFWASDIFSFVFGSAWAKAGLYAAIYAPAAYIRLFTGWSTRIYDIQQKQHISFLIVLVFAIFKVSLVWGLLHAGAKPIYAVLAYSFAMFAYGAVYLAGIFKVAGFRMTGLYRLAGRIFLLSVVFSGIIFVIGRTISWPALQFAAGGMAVLLPAAHWSRQYLRRPSDGLHGGM